MKRWTVRLAAVVLAVTAHTVQANVTIDLVTVGNPGNAGEQSRLALYGDAAYYGGVDYTYQIGKYEVTTGEYCEFLNAVAAYDTYGLWGDSKIVRSGSLGSYSYSVPRDWKDRPVYTTWLSAARFANWLHNGQPTGAQDNSTTEDGAYFLDGATQFDWGLWKITRQSDATWFIPTDNEWYKAAYHKNDGVTGNYFGYPTGSDSLPSNVLTDPDPGNNANFAEPGVGGEGDPGFAIGSPYYRTITGAFENSQSPYGTFDQGGNVREWVETVWNGIRGSRGGDLYSLAGGLHASSSPAVGGVRFGFRVATVPEPGTITLLVCGLVAGLIWWRRRRIAG